MFKSIESIDQIGYVVEDLDTEIRRWNEKGAGTFLTFRDLQVPLQYRGQDAVQHLSIALGQFDGVQIELIQQHDRAPSIFTDVFPDQWPAADNGFHHIGMTSSNFDATCAQLTAEGHVNAMCGEFGGYRFAFFDTRSKLGFFYEVFEGNEAMRAFFDSVKNA